MQSSAFVRRGRLRAATPPARQLDSTERPPEGQSTATPPLYESAL